MNNGQRGIPGQVADVQLAPIMEYRFEPMPAEPPAAQPAGAPTWDAEAFAKLEARINSLTFEGWTVQAWTARYVILGRVTGMRQIAVDMARVIVPAYGAVGRA